MGNLDHLKTPRDLNSTLVDKILFVTIARGEVYAYNLAKTFGVTTPTIVPVLHRLYKKYGILNMRQGENYKKLYRMDYTSNFFMNYLKAGDPALKEKIIKGILETYYFRSNMFLEIIRRYSEFITLLNANPIEFNETFSYISNRKFRFSNQINVYVSDLLYSMGYIGATIRMYEKGKDIRNMYFDITPSEIKILNKWGEIFLNKLIDEKSIMNIKRLR